MILLICRHYPSDSSNFLSSCSAIGSFGEYSRTDVKNFCASSFFPSFRFKYPRNSLKKLEFDPDPNCDCNPLISCAFEGDFDDALGDGVNGEELGGGLNPRWHGVVWPDVATEGEEDERGAQDELECRVARAAERCQGGCEGEVAGDHDPDEFHDFDGCVASVPGEERAEVDVDECRSEADEEGVEQVTPEVIDEPEIFLGE